MDFSALTTLRTGGPATDLMVAEHEKELVDAITDADQSERDVLVIGAGSNLVVSDRGFDGLIINDGRTKISEVDSFVSCGGSTVRVTAGTGFDQFVSFTVERDLGGLEALSGIPGTVGGAIATNAGAYGQEIAQTIASVRALDRTSGYVRTLSRFDLYLGYRSSILRRSTADTAAGEGRTWGPTGRWVILDATFQLRSASLSEPVRYLSLANALGVEEGARVPSRLVRKTVLELRRLSGILLDPRDHDSWSVGSYFANPVLNEEEAASLPKDAPRFPLRNQAMFVSGTVHKQAPILVGRTKVPAKWLITQAGFETGYRVRPESRVALSYKDNGAITNRGGASTEEVLELASVVRDRVHERFGIVLKAQAVPVGLDAI